MCVERGSWGDIRDKEEGGKKMGRKMVWGKLFAGHLYYHK